MDWSLFFSGGLVIANIVLAGCMWYQCGILKKTLKATAKNAEAAWHNAKAAKRSADAIPTMEQAYVFAEVRVEGEVKAGANQLEAALYLRNYGKTPAVIREIAFGGAKGEGPPMTEKEKLAPHAPLVTFIGAGKEEKEDRYSFHLSEEEWGKLISLPRELKLYCFGHVVYETVFGRERRHDFCWEFIPAQGRFARSPETS